MNLKSGFSRFLSADPGRLHFAAHSHHPWPDITYQAHLDNWELAASRADFKWETIFGEVIPETQQLIADTVGLTDRHSLTFAPNTHSLVVRIFSCLEPPVRLLTTDSEFHSFARQTRRWEEEGLALVDRVPAQPFDTFAERFTKEIGSGAHDLVYLSQVFYNTGFVVPDLGRIIRSAPNESTYIVVDGYHAFMALPVDIAPFQDRAFYLAGGYKYAMAGEGVCFLHSPSGYGPRPVNTGWYAGFGDLEQGVGEEIPYPTDGFRFAGATYDTSGLFRMRAVLSWLKAESVSPHEIHDHVTELQDLYLASGPSPGELMPPEGCERGNFLTFHTPAAAAWHARLRGEGVVTDYRGDHLRLGFGVYQDQSDVEELIDRARRVTV